MVNLLKAHLGSVVTMTSFDIGSVSQLSPHLPIFGIHLFDTERVKLSNKIVVFFFLRQLINDIKRIELIRTEFSLMF